MSINPHGEIPEFRRRYRYLVVVVGLVFVVLLGRLWQMQIVQGESYRKKSENNFVQGIRIPTVRGLIYDRRGRPLVTNRPSFDVYVTPRFATAATLERLSEELVLPPETAKDLAQRVAAVSGQKRYDPMLALRDISRDQMAHLEAHKEELAGVSVVARAHRNFIHGNLGAHVLGYLNEITAEELGRDKARVYQPGDLIGRHGVERMYEAHLRGVAGREQIVVDARGRRKTGEEAAELLRGERRVEPKPGHNLTLTIDIEVQRLVERSLRAYLRRPPWCSRWRAGGSWPAPPSRRSSPTCSRDG
jgi:penicillin-binding protein 2